MISGFAPSQIIMTGHGINRIEKVLLIAQRLGKLSASIAAYWTTVRLGPMSGMGVNRVVLTVSRYFRSTSISRPSSGSVGMSQKCQ
jgi:hypothetical protein